MWRCPGGNKILTGPLLGVFLIGLERTIEIVSGVAKKEPLTHLDQLPNSERRLDVLAYLAHHLVLSQEPHPEHTAWAEGAIHDTFMVAAHYGMAVSKQKLPVDLSPIRWRCLQVLGARFEGPLGEENPEAVLAALQSGKAKPDDAVGDDYKFLYTGGGSRNKWEGLFESLADGILWDRDFEMADMMTSLPAEIYKQIDAEAGIGADYFKSALPEVSRRPNVFLALKDPEVRARIAPAPEVRALDEFLLKAFQAAAVK